jgi:DNA-directed RNA polymerase specialized sigma24 family protein
MFERATTHDANSAPLGANPSKEECEIILLRRQGKSWPEVAAITGRSPDSCRRYLGRIITHLARLMKLPDVAFDDG